MSKPARDIFLKINDKFSVGADSLQWIAYRTRGNRIIPVAFISSTKLILLRCLKEAGCDEHKTALHHANTDLLLSDRPCLLEGNAVEGECLIALPLSPTMLFFICNREHQVEALLSMQPTSLVKGVNRASVLSAADRVYGTGTHHLTLVEKFLRSDNGPPR